MDYERRSEGETGSEYISNRESGYSESEMALEVEVRAGEWKNLKRFKTYRQRSRQGKILATYQAVTNRLNQLVAMYYKIVAENPHGGEKLLAQLKELRLLQDILLNCLIWEPKGKLEKSMVPKEVWDMIE